MQQSLGVLGTPIRNSFLFCSLVHSHCESGRHHYMQGQHTTLRSSSPEAVTLPRSEGNIIFMCPPYGASRRAPLYSYDEVLKYI